MSAQNHIEYNACAQLASASYEAQSIEKNQDYEIFYREGFSPEIPYSQT